MPVDRTLGEDLARTLAELYGEAAARIVEGMARQLKAGIARPDWVDQKLGSINDLRNAVQMVLRKLDADGESAAEQAIVVAFARGGDTAFTELVKAGYLTAEQVNAIRQTLPGAEAINRLVFSLVSTLRGTHLRILRWTLDTYREVIARTVATGVLLGTEPRIRTAQRAWDDLISRGVTGFVDRSGRRWELASYVEMATRTGTAQAAVQGHLDRLGAAGVDLVIVSDAPQECFRCRPWEGKILDRSVRGVRHIHLEHATIDGHMVAVHIAGSVAEAIAAGLLHPNCRHSLSSYLPGITKTPTHTRDPDGDKARQDLRALERKVRKEKLQAAAALDPDAAKFHEAKARDYQAQIRDHIATAPTTLFRHREREQIGTAR